jgi:hypothetical protein
MKSRCLDRRNKQYIDYGGRGIQISASWLDFNIFCQWCLDHGSAKGLHLDRVGNDDNYSPENCRFVHPIVNARNKRNSVIISAFGETKNVQDWGDDQRAVVCAQTIRRRVDAGWDTEEAITLTSQMFRQRGIFKCGHTMQEDNVYRRAYGHRMCKICTKDRARSQNRKKEN